MCIIVDNNRAHLFFSEPKADVALPIWQWLVEKGGILIYGGRLATELKGMAKAGKLLLELQKAGRAFREDDEAITSKEVQIRKDGKCRSNDQHVIALAQVSGARVLFTADRDLMSDFCRVELLRPKGKVYQRPEHAELLGHHPGCRGRRSRKKGRTVEKSRGNR